LAAPLLAVFAGTVVHSTPYNNLTLFNLTANTGEAPARGFAIFPASKWFWWRLGPVPALALVPLAALGWAAKLGCSLQS
jgi:hypothetical protein